MDIYLIDVSCYRLKSVQENKPLGKPKDVDASDQSDNDDDTNVSQDKDSFSQEVSATFTLLVA